MTSIKKYLDLQNDELLKTTIWAYQEALGSAGQNAERAIPGDEYPLSANLGKLQDHLLADPKAASVIQMQHAVDAEFRQWADSVERHLRAKATEAREIMLVVADAAQAIGNRDQRYGQRFRELTTRLRKITDLDDLSEVRRSLMASVSELTADVLSMETEGKNTIASLETKLEAYRKQLAEAERRGCVDVLTGLMNRRGTELAMTTRMEAGAAFCVVVLDLNSFKATNDNYGHLAGDDLLKQFSAELRAHCRPGDLIGRWGGDEFIIVTSGDSNDAQDTVNRIRKWAFGTYKVRTAQGSCPIELTAAIGFATWDLREDITQLLVRADESMYDEKRKKILRV